MRRWTPTSALPVVAAATAASCPMDTDYPPFSHAAHEAGHACAAAMMGGPPFSYVTLAVLAEEDRHLDRPHVWVDDEVFADYVRGGRRRDRRARLQACFNDIVFCLAGPVAESICTDVPFADVLVDTGSADLEHASVVAAHVAGSANKNRVLAAALKHARRLLLGADGLRALLRVATKLHQRGRLEAEEVRGLIEHKPHEDDLDLFADVDLEDDVVVVLEDPVTRDLREQLRRMLSGSLDGRGGHPARCRC